MTVYATHKACCVDGIVFIDEVRHSDAFWRAHEYFISIGVADVGTLMDCDEIHWRYGYLMSDGTYKWENSRGPAPTRELIRYEDLIQCAT